MPTIESIEYFSAGCAGQYKCFKNFNLCYQKNDFGLAAIWSFFLQRATRKDMIPIREKLNEG